jgi:hypothetical protein
MAELIRTCKAWSTGLGEAGGRRQAVTVARSVGEAVGGMVLGVLLLPVVGYAILRGN